MKKRTLILLIAILAFTTKFYAQSNVRDLEKEKKIEAQLNAIDPTVVKYFKDGTIALDKGDLKLSDEFYSMVYIKAPNFDPLLRRLGSVRFQMGAKEEGIAMCEKAVSLNKTVYNILSLSNCLIQTGNRDNINRALLLLDEAQLLPEGDIVDIYALMGEIYLQLENIEQLRLVTDKMLKSYPKDMSTHYYAAIIAAHDEEWIKSKKEILLAGKYGLSEDVVDKFLDSGINSRAVAGITIKYFLWIVALWIIGLFLLYFVGKLLSNITLKSIENDNFSSDTDNSKNLLRSIYKLLINAGGIYYYISLPIILVLLLGVVAGLLYMFIQLGHIPIKIMLLLIIGAVMSIYGMIRSLLVKVKYTDPGRALKREEAPGLYKLVLDVAGKINTRPIDEIRITHYTDLAVYERGSWKEKLQDKATRILILGTGVLNDFKTSDFKAVLAHEYGHFSHRDTAGGEVALRVRNDITKYFYALYNAGQNVWWNIAFLFLRLYNFIFRRISHGSTRLQEVLADRVAAKTYGSLAFQNGLTHVIKRNIEFDKLANDEIETSKKENRMFSNLYELTSNSTYIYDEELKKELNRATTEDDTHPSPVDRFRYVSRINTPNIPEDSSLVKEFFTDWEGITLEMTKLVEELVKRD